MSADLFGLLQMLGISPQVAQPEPTDDERVLAILNQHRGKNFVERILRPQEWPVLRDEEAGPGNIATHSMAWEHIGPKGQETPAVLPTVIYDPKTKKLKRLPLEEAKRYAFETGEFIAFPSEAEADWFSKSYKKGSFRPSSKDFLRSKP